MSEPITYIHDGDSRCSLLDPGQLEHFLASDEGKRLICGDRRHCGICVYDEDGLLYPNAVSDIIKTAAQQVWLSSLVSFPASSLDEPVIAGFIASVTEHYPLLYDELGTLGREDALFSPGSLSPRKGDDGRMRTGMHCDPSTETEAKVYASTCFVELGDVMGKHISGFHGFHYSEQPLEMMRALSLGREDTDAYAALSDVCQFPGNLRADLSVGPSRNDLKMLKETARRAEDCFELWNRALKGCFAFDPTFHDTASMLYTEYEELGRLLQVDSLLDAYYSGVPMDDIFA